MSYDLVPVGERANEALERVMDIFGRSGVSLAECLDTDAAALSASDMRYFGGEYFGKVPTYAVFMRYLNKLPVMKRDEFLSEVAEVEASISARGMSRIANGESMGIDEVRRFNMMKDINRISERRIDRFDKRAAARADNAEKGIDMAARLITALSNADLLKIKGRVDAIDAEYREIEIATSEPILPKVETNE